MQKVIVITGGTSGIGLATLQALAASNWKIVLLARNVERAKALTEKYPNVELVTIHCDLDDLASVTLAAKQVIAHTKRIDVLLNNAGALFTSREITKDGFEMSMGLNHLSHFLLTKHLIEVLKSSRARVINVSSDAHHIGKLNFDDLMYEKNGYKSFKAYGDSKLANIYFSKELHRRYADSGLTAFSLHPGVVATNFGGNFSSKALNVLYFIGKPFMISPEKGAATQLMLVTKAGIENLSGKYFKNSKVAKPAKRAEDEKVAAKLWEISEELVAPFA